jgi:phage/plasmid primase-like uncharacterized protein
MSAEFAVHLANCGFRLEAPAVADGRLRRVAWHGRKASDKTGWYVLHAHPDGWEAAAWGDWREGRSETWTSKEPRKVSSMARAAMDAAIKRAKEAAAAEKLAAAAAAEGRAWVIWSNGEPAVEHDYLTRKNITGTGLRVTRGDLVVPLRDADGILRNVQRIGPDGQKRFLKEAAVSGLAWIRGTLPASGGDVVICEGMATAATLAALSGAPVVAAMNAGNLGVVAAWVREQCPEARILIAADDDRWERDGTPRPAEKNVGMVKAAVAAAAVRGLVAAPVFSDVASRGTDWNDLLCEEGEMSARAKWATALGVATLDAQVAAMGEVEFAQRKPQLAAAYRAAGAGAVGPRLLDAKRKEVAAKKAAAMPAGDGAAAVLSRLMAEPELWHDQFGQAFATFDLDGRRVNARIEGQAFRDWLRMAYEDETGATMPPAREAVNGCIEQAASRARSRGARQESFVRVGWDGEVRYLDLGRDDWSAVRVDASGWDVVMDVPVKFTRGDGNGALPVPERMPGGLDPLWGIVNVAPDDRPLVAGWLLSAMLGNASAFGLNLHGAQGTAKSTATRILRRMIDPAPGLTQPLSAKRLDELPLTCLDQWVPCFENISWLEDEVQDALCMLTTGLSLRNRKLYTDASMVTYNVRRPWIINGINNVCSRNDLAERAVPVGLQMLAPEARRTEAEVEAVFEAAWPGLLAALLDAVSMASDPGTRQRAAAFLASEKLSHRMADALVWVTAGEESFGFPAGSFIRRLTALQEEAGREALADHPAVLAIQDLLAESGKKTSEWTCPQPAEWTGGNDDLLSRIEDLSPGKRLPKGCEDARKLGMWLKREAGRLRQVFGIEVGEAKVEWLNGTSKRVRTIKMKE